MQFEKVKLSEESQDVFLELSNIGIGRAAANMSELAGRQVDISVPRLDVFDRETFALQDMEEQDTVAYVSQAFSGDLVGEAIIMLSQAGALRLSSLLFEEDTPSQTFDENEQASILELGNIMIGGILGTFSNEFEANINYDVPEIQVKGFDDFVELVKPAESVILVIKATLSIGSANVDSKVLLLFNEETCYRIATMLDEAS